MWASVCVSRKKITSHCLFFLSCSEFSPWNVRFPFPPCAYSLYDMWKVIVCACVCMHGFYAEAYICLTRALCTHTVCPFREVKLPSFVQSDQVCELKGKWMFWWKQCYQMIKGLFANMFSTSDFFFTTAGTFSWSVSANQHLYSGHIQQLFGHKKGRQ